MHCGVLLRGSASVAWRSYTRVRVSGPRGGVKELHETSVIDRGRARCGGRDASARSSLGISRVPECHGCSQYVLFDAGSRYSWCAARAQRTLMTNPAYYQQTSLCAMYRATYAWLLATLLVADDLLLLCALSHDFSLLLFFVARGSEGGRPM